MIVTEEEARTKWCPHARLGAEAGCNRAAAPSDFKADRALCVASACMAWKWMRYHSPEELEARKAHGLAVEVPKGYCGL